VLSLPLFPLINTRGEKGARDGKKKKRGEIIEKRTNKNRKKNRKK
jgi:hypothetical protein